VSTLIITTRDFAESPCSTSGTPALIRWHLAATLHASSYTAMICTRCMASLSLLSIHGRVHAVIESAQYSRERICQSSGALVQSSVWGVVGRERVRVDATGRQFDSPELLKEHRALSIRPFLSSTHSGTLCWPSSFFTKRSEDGFSSRNPRNNTRSGLTRR